MGMLSTGVDVHVADDVATKASLGKHTFHNFDEQGVVAGFDVLVVSLHAQDSGGSDTLTAGISCIRKVFTVIPFLAGKLHFVGVDNDDIVAALYKRSVAGFVFASKNKGDY